MSTINDLFNNVNEDVSDSENNDNDSQDKSKSSKNNNRGSIKKLSKSIPLELKQEIKEISEQVLGNDKEKNKKRREKYNEDKPRNFPVISYRFMCGSTGQIYNRLANESYFNSETLFNNMMKQKKEYDREISRIMPTFIKINEALNDNPYLNILGYLYKDIQGVIVNCEKKTIKKKEPVVFDDDKEIEIDIEDYDNEKPFDSRSAFFN